MYAHIVGVASGIIIGFVLAMVSLFADRRQRSVCYGHSSRKNASSDVQGDYNELKQEVGRLQMKIDEINRQRYVINACPSIDSSYDFQSACEELDISDFDLREEYETHNDNCGNSQEALKYQEKLNDIDKILEGDDRDKIIKALEELEDLCYKNPEDVELLIRTGKAHVRLSEGQSRYDTKSHIDKGIEALTAALRLNDNHAEVHKWYGILLGLRGQLQPLTQQINYGILFKKHCDLACAINPNDPVLHHLLGVFDYKIAELGWFQKSVAESISGQTLNSTYTDALKRFMTAEKLSVHRNCREQKENKTMIGKTLIALDNREEAVLWFLKADNLGPADATLDQEVKDLLKKYR